MATIYETDTNILAPGYFGQGMNEDTYDLIEQEASLDDEHYGQDYVEEVVVSSPTTTTVSSNYFMLKEPAVVSIANNGGGFYVTPFGREARPIWVKNGPGWGEGDILLPDQCLFYNPGTRQSQGLYSWVQNMEAVLKALSHKSIDQVPDDLVFLEEGETNDLPLDQAREEIRTMTSSKDKARTLKEYLAI